MARGAPVELQAYESCYSTEEIFLKQRQGKAVESDLFRKPGLQDSFPGTLLEKMARHGWLDAIILYINRFLQDCI